MEVWKDTIHCKDYKVSNLGRVKSFKFGKEKIIKQFLNGRGYYSVPLYYDKKTHTKRVHVLVAESFLNHITDGTTNLSVDHINNIKTDNRLENLQIITHSQNISKQVTNKLGVTGVRSNGNNKFYAYISINNKHIHLGTFNTIEDAVNARNNKKNNK